MQGVMQVPLQHLPLRRDESEATQEPVMGSLVPPIREEQPEHRQQHSGLGAAMASGTGPGQAGETNHVQMQHPGGRALFSTRFLVSRRLIPIS